MDPVCKELSQRALFLFLPESSASGGAGGRREAGRGGWRVTGGHCRTGTAGPGGCGSPERSRPGTAGRSGRRPDAHCGAELVYSGAAGGRTAAHHCGGQPCEPPLSPFSFRSLNLLSLCCEALVVCLAEHGSGKKLIAQFARFPRVGCLEDAGCSHIVPYYRAVSV